MTRIPLLAAACLVALLVVPAPGAAAVSDPCYGYRVGWEGYTQHCVHPTDPDCLVETRTWTGADEFWYCTGV